MNWGLPFPPQAYESAAQRDDLAGEMIYLFLPMVKFERPNLLDIHG